MEVWVIFFLDSGDYPYNTRGLLDYQYSKEHQQVGKKLKDTTDLSLFRLPSDIFRFRH